MLSQTIKEWIKKRIIPIYDDDFIGRWVYFSTVRIINVFILIFLATNFIGKPMVCQITPETDNEYMRDTYISFCMAENSLLTIFGGDTRYTPDDYNSRRYDYWLILFALIIQLFIFSLPSYLWNELGLRRTINLDFFIKKLVDGLEYPKLKTHFIEILSFTNAKAAKNGNHFSNSFLFHKFLNFVNSFMHLYFINNFINFSYSFWGAGILNDFIFNQKIKENFPKDFYCDFIKDGINFDFNVSILCDISINNAIEMSYIFLWFWFLISTILNIFNFVYWIVISFIPSYSREFIKSQLNTFNSHKIDDEKVDAFIKNGVTKDAILILRLIDSASFGTQITSDSIKALYDEWKNPKVKNKKFQFYRL